MLDPTNPNKVNTSTYIYNNPESIKRAQAKGWIIDPIQNPQGILHHTYGLNTKQKYIDTLISSYDENDEENTELLEVIELYYDKSI